MAHDAGLWPWDWPGRLWVVDVTSAGLRNSPVVGVYGTGADLQVIDEGTLFGRKDHRVHCPALWRRTRLVEPVVGLLASLHPAYCGEHAQGRAAGD